MSKLKKSRRIVIVIGFVLCSFLGFGQSSFWIEGQIRPRFEFRNGFKTLLNDTLQPAAFIEQRTRLGMGYRNNFIEAFIAFQDVRVWGSTPVANKLAGNFALFQGWVKINLAKHLYLKIGRQVLSYDSQRLLGAANWAVQARAHDAVLLNYKNDSIGLEFQVGGAYNVEAASLTNMPYSISGNARTMQFVRVKKTFKPIDITLFALNVGQEAGQQLNFEMSVGGLIKLKFGNFSTLLEGHYQFGHNTANLRVNAYLASLKLEYKLPKPVLAFELGVDLLSGTNQNEQSNVDNSFTPWMGTNHAHYGHMDYFYVGSSHGDIGLLNALFRLKYSPIKKIKTSLTYHYFHAPSTITNATNGQLGHEVDFTFDYKIKKYLTLQLGYAHLVGTPTLELIKPTGRYTNVTNWAWLMLDCNLEFFRHNFKKKVSPNNKF